MSLHYRQGIFVTDNKNCLSSEEVRSSHKQDTLLGSAKQEDGLLSPSNTAASDGWASPARTMCKPFAPGLGPGGARGRKPPNLTETYATTFATAKS